MLDQDGIHPRTVAAIRSGVIDYGIGFGGLIVNKGVGVSGTSIPAGTQIYKDVSFGPMPEVMRFAPFGQVGWEVVWTCSFSIVETAQTTSGAPLLALNYGVDYSYDDRGYTTISISGHYELPISAAHYDTMQPQGNGTSRLKPTTDDFWDRIRFRVPEFFRVGPRHHGINPAKNRGEFSYVISELEGDPYPPGVVHADIDESWENAEPQSFSGWNGSIGGSIEIAKGQHPSIAAERFLNMYIHRLTQMRQAIAAGAKDNKFSGYVLPVRFSFGCKRFTQKFTFAASYMVAGGIPEFMKSSGIFTPLNTTYDAWSQSMVIPWSSRGNANAKTTTEVIVASGNNLQSAGYTIELTATQPKLGKEAPYLTFDCAGLEAENSYLAYDNTIQAVRVANVYRHKYAQSPGKLANPSAFGNTNEKPAGVSSNLDGGVLVEVAKAIGSIAGIGGTTDALSGITAAHLSHSITNAVNKNTKADPLEYAGTPRDYVVMRGKMLRIKYKPEIPSINLVGGSQPSLVNEIVVAPKVIAMIGDCPVYFSAWEKIYMMPEGYASTEIQPSHAANWACTKPFG